MKTRPRRRLVLFLDGTWNQDDDQHPPTNIVRMREMLKIGVDQALSKDSLQIQNDTGSRATGSIIEENGHLLEYVVYYDRGVGTGAWLDPLRGGLFGKGLDHNIRQAYRFLTEHYADGDEIYIFGFSRGAFTARSLVGFIFAVGLLRPRSCTPETERRAWRHYRRNPQDRYCAEWFALEPHVFDRRALRITCLGVFDTVGALGVPLTGFRSANSAKYAFHNTELSSIVDVSLHAVAIDERRRPFEAALWQRPKFKRDATARIEQVWFPGAHSDIGGIYEAVHVSALALLQPSARIHFEGESHPVPYGPPNLIAALPAIAATYREADAAIWELWSPFTRKLPNGTVSEPELCVVGWDGVRIPPSKIPGDPGGLAVLKQLPPNPKALGLIQRNPPKAGCSAMPPAA